MQNDVAREIEINSALDRLGSDPDDPSLFVTNSGLRLRLRRVSAQILTDAVIRLTVPKIPRDFNEAKGREEDNPGHPDYVTAMRNYNYDASILAFSTYFILGTKIEGQLPPDLEPIASDGWADDLKAVDPNVDVPPSGPRRYLAWLKYYVLSDAEQADLLNKCMRYSGSTLEVDVVRAQATFRDRQGRDTSVGVPSTTGESRSGDYTGEAPRNGTGVRGEGSSDLRALPVGPVDQQPYSE